MPAAVEDGLLRLCKAENSVLTPVGKELRTLLETWSEDHTINWCELMTTGSTPDSSVIVTPCYMV